MQNWQQYNMPPPDCSASKWFISTILLLFIGSQYAMHVIAYELLAFHGHQSKMNIPANSVYECYHLEKNMDQSVPPTTPLTNPQGNSSAAQSDLQLQVIELQMNMAHLELTVERLDEVIARQDKHIQTVQRQLQLIYKQVESQDTEGGIAPFDVMSDRPPHY